MVKLLGIDYGLERTGLAVTDATGTMAFPLRALALAQFGNRSALLDEIARECLQNSCEAVVMGLPVLDDNQETEMSRQARNIVKRLKRRLEKPFYYMPEFLSSHEALGLLREAGLSASKIKKALDQQAACQILSSFLAQPERLRIKA